MNYPPRITFLEGEMDDIEHTRSAVKAAIDTLWKIMDTAGSTEDRIAAARELLTLNQSLEMRNQTDRMIAMHSDRSGGLFS